MAKQNNQQKTPLYSVYGARLSNSGKYVNLSLVRGEDDNKKWATACVKKKSKYIKVKVTACTIVLTIPRLDVDDVEDEDEDEDEYEDEDEDEDGKPLTDEGLTPVGNDKLPF